VGTAEDPADLAFADVVLADMVAVGQLLSMLG